MLISHRKQFIYTKTKKTAGTSVEVFFEPYCMPEGAWQFQHARDQYVNESGIIGYRGEHRGASEWFNHMSADSVKEMIGEEIWERYFKFAVIRNPFDQLVSAFFFSQRASEQQADPVGRFRKWLRDGGGVFDRNVYMIEGKICLDYFIRYEALQEGIQIVCERLGVPFDPVRLPRLKSGIRQRDIPVAAFYDAETQAIVEDKYAFELDTFGYSFPGN